MNLSLTTHNPAPPPRFKTPGLGSFAASLTAISFFVYAANGVGFSLTQLLSGMPEIRRVLAEMFPPDLQRIGSISAAILETFQMALVRNGLRDMPQFLSRNFRQSNAFASSDNFLRCPHISVALQNCS